MRKYIFLFIAFSFYWGATAQSPFKICGDNLITNSTFQTAANNATNVPGWTFTPPGNEQGWKKAKTLIYGDYLIINRKGTFSALPDNAKLTPNSSKVIKYRFTTSGTEPVNFSVYAGTQELATYGPHGGWADGRFFVHPGVYAEIHQEYLFENYQYVDNVTGTTVKEASKYIANNIWYEITLFVPNYKGGEGNIRFEYKRDDGILRQILLDNVEMYDALPTPSINGFEYTLGENEFTYDLTSINIENKGTKYYEQWYNEDGTEVANPNAVPKGIYYVAFKSGGGCISNKTKVRVSPANCGKNIIKNSNFAENTPQTCPGGYPNSRGSSSMFGSPRVGSVKDWQILPDHGSDLCEHMVALSYGTFFGKQSFGMDADVLQYFRLSQNIKLCKGTVYKLSLDFAVEMVGTVPVGQNRNMFVKIGDIPLFTIGVWVDGLLSGYKRQVAVHSVNGGNAIGSIIGDFTIDGNHYTPSTKAILGEVGLGGYDKVSQLEQRKFYHLEVHFVYPAGKVNEDTNITFRAREGMIPYFANVSIVPTDDFESDEFKNNENSASIDCDKGTYNLKEAQPENVTDREYVWYYDEAKQHPIPVADDGSLEVSEGIYYMETVSLCSGCKSRPRAFTVNSDNCTEVSGSVWNDYDGIDNGIDNTLRKVSEGLYAVLIQNGKVVKSQKVKVGEGTYKLTARVGDYRVLLSEIQPANGSDAGTLTLGKYRYTGERIGTQVIQPNADKTSFNPAETTFSLGNGVKKKTVDFGIALPPIAIDVEKSFCYDARESSYTLPAPTGIDDDPAFNGGIGQKIVIENIEKNGGTLSYNGEDIDNVGITIPNFDPNLFKYIVQPRLEGYHLKVEYKWIDESGMKSLESAFIDVKLMGKLEASFEIPKTVVKNCDLEIIFSAKNGVSPYTFTYYLNGQEKVVTSSYGTGTVSVTEHVTAPELKTGTYLVELKAVSDDMECSEDIEAQSKRVFVSCNGDKIKCFKPAELLGQTAPTTVGVSTLKRDMQTDWTANSHNGFIKMESKTKGFVITRMTTNEINAIADPKEGMLVWDTEALCLKLYNGTAWVCLTQGCDE